MGRKEVDGNIVSHRHAALIALGMNRVDVVVTSNLDQLRKAETKWFKTEYPTRSRETRSHRGLGNLPSKRFLEAHGVKSNGVLELLSRKEAAMCLPKSGIVEEISRYFGEGRRFRGDTEPLQERAREIFSTPGNVPVHYLTVRRVITEEAERELLLRNILCLADVAKALRCLCHIQDDNAVSPFDKSMCDEIKKVLKELGLA